MVPRRLIKSIAVENVELRQTLLIFPVDFLRHQGPKHMAQFQELAFGEMAVSLVANGEPLSFRGYKLVTSKEATWASIPRKWLRDVGARVGDDLDLYTTDDPSVLFIRYRKFALPNP
jgi:hypothetical protein